MLRKLITAVVAVVTVLAATIAIAAPASAHGSRSVRRPVIFVHGFVGSGAQFETQAQRFASNGYPAGLIGVEEYDSTFGTMSMADVWTDLDAKIAQLLAASGADKVELVGHSLGTAVSMGFLGSSTDRAAKVAHYVNLDGGTASSPPGGVPTLAVWGEGSTTRQIVGATNVYQSDQSHVQVATSAETFDAMYRFFRGRNPKTTDVVPEHRLALSGRVALFPTNAGAEGTTLQVWEVDSRTGLRTRNHPNATYSIGADGAFGPFRGRNDKRYEFAVVWADSVHHFYYEPFLRTDQLIRLQTQEPGTGLDALREKSDGTSSINFIRYKELWGDQGGGSDIMTVEGERVLTPAIAPRAKRLNALFTFDAGLDGVTDLSAPIPSFSGLPFISGADVYLPATTPPNATIHVALVPRGGACVLERINVPNWASSDHFTTIQFRDFAQRRGA